MSRLFFLWASVLLVVNRSSSHSSSSWCYTATAFQQPSLTVSSARVLHHQRLRQTVSAAAPLLSSSKIALNTRSTNKLSILQSTADAAAAAPLDDDGDSKDSAATESTGTATIPSHVFNLVKGIVGAGVLTLPAGIATYGNAPGAILPAVALIVAIGSLSGYGFGLIGRVCALTDTQSYRGAWEKSVSEKSSGYIATAVTLKTMFAILAYSMILGDTFQSLAMSAGLHSVSKTVTLTAVTTCLLLPLCLLKNLSSLAPFSLLGTLGMVYTAMAMAVRYFGKAYATGGTFAADLPAKLRPAFGSVGAAGALSPKTAILLGMLSTSYMVRKCVFLRCMLLTEILARTPFELTRCLATLDFQQAHFNAPKFYIELKNNTIPRFLKVVSTSFGISIGLFCIIASLGFLTFGGNSSGLILNK